MSVKNSPQLNGGLSDFLLHSLELSVLDQLFGPLSAAPALSPAAPSLSLSISSLAAAAAPVVSPTSTSAGLRGDGGWSHLWRRPCGHARQRALICSAVDSQKLNNDMAAVLSSPAPAGTGIEQ